MVGEVYCGVFVDGPMTSDDLLHRVHQVLGGVVSGAGITWPGWDLDVRRNPNRGGFPEDFLYWP